MIYTINDKEVTQEEFDRITSEGAPPRDKKVEALLNECDKHQKEIGGRVDLDKLIYAFEPAYKKVNNQIELTEKEQVNVYISQVLADNDWEIANIQRFNKHPMGKSYDYESFTDTELVGAFINSKHNGDLEDIKNIMVKRDEQGKSRLTPESEEEQKRRLDLAGRGKTSLIKHPIVPLNIDTSNLGKKDSENKVDYSEIDWGFITGMAKRMNSHKGEYPANNWKKNIDVNELKQALLRHVLEIMEGRYDDNGELGHLYAVALNAQMIAYQIKNYKSKV